MGALLHPFSHYWAKQNKERRVFSVISRGPNGAYLLDHTHLHEIYPTSSSSRTSFILHLIFGHIFGAKMISRESTKKARKKSKNKSSTNPDDLRILSSFYCSGRTPTHWLHRWSLVPWPFLFGHRSATDGVMYCPLSLARFLPLWTEPWLRDRAKLNDLAKPPSHFIKSHKI